MKTNLICTWIFTYMLCAGKIMGDPDISWYAVPAPVLIVGFTYFVFRAVATNK